MIAALRGVLPIVPTPFTPEDAVDEVSLKKVATHAIEAGAAALVFPGVASEDLYLSSKERRSALSLVAGVAKGRLPVIAGVNSADPAEMVEITRMAVEAGADGIMAMAVPAMDGACGTWFGRIGAALGEDRPIILQNLFKPRGADLSAEEMLALAAEVPAIRYVKEEGIPSGPKVSRLVAGCGADLDGVIGGGGARYLLEELDRGAIATMPAIELLDLHVALYRAYAAHDRAEALRLYERSLPLLLIQAPYRMRLTKLILKHRGLIACDAVREPLPEMDAELSELVLELYERASLTRELADA
ncbi:dihydrodipicolinate synthase family protein [Marinovum sp.]|uniref:dihydrodipicolinate synthase family protein n=1 Tax=Marinovum sp. TaxID=2024839 RepID=UPI002B26658C|nr:dihydrodipicolinate synthase family protein [Marinovum sp.]